MSASSRKAKSKPRRKAGPMLDRHAVFLDLKRVLEKALSELRDGDPEKADDLLAIALGRVYAAIDQAGEGGVA